MLIPVRSATSGWPPTGWVFVACDVGQGDALVLNAGPHAAVEVDAGPDPVAIDRCLRDLGIEQIPLLVLTHFHLDHVAGLPGVVRGRSVGALFTGPLDEPAAGSVIVHRIAAAQHLQVRSPPVGTQLDVGAVHLDVLGPPSAFHGTRSDPNNSSLVLRAVGRRRADHAARRRRGRGAAGAARLAAPTCAPTCSRCRTTARPTPTLTSWPRCRPGSRWSASG